MSATVHQQKPNLLQRLWVRVQAWRAGADESALPVRMPTATHGRMPKATPTLAQLGIDQGLLWGTVALLLWGLVMVYSASIAMPDNPRFANY